MQEINETVRKAHAGRIMVVEDDEDLRLTLSDWLSLKGYAVWTAQDGLEALELAARQGFEVVVTDLKMPRCDGLHLLSVLKAKDPLVQVIFLTGEASMNDAIEALREGRSFDFLQKPLNDFQRLETVIRRALAHRAQLPEQAESQALPTAAHLILTPQVLVAIADERVLLRAFYYIEAYFRESIGLREVAAATEYSSSYLTHRMRRKTGKTVQQWILTFKMTEAKRMVLTSAASMQQIASALGYGDPSYFHRQFRQWHGVSPQQLRLEGIAVEDGGERSR